MALVMHHLRMAVGCCRNAAAACGLPGASAGWRENPVFCVRVMRNQDFPSSVAYEYDVFSGGEVHSVNGHVDDQDVFAGHFLL